MHTNPLILITIYEDKVILSKECDVMGNIYSVELTLDEYNILNSPNRPNIQDFLPHLSVEQREFLISGYTPNEWNEIWDSKNYDIIL